MTTDSILTSEGLSGALIDRRLEEWVGRWVNTTLELRAPPHDKECAGKVEASIVYRRFYSYMFLCVTKLALRCLESLRGCACTRSEVCCQACRVCQGFASGLRVTRRSTTNTNFDIILPPRKSDSVYFYVTHYFSDTRAGQDARLFTHRPPKYLDC